MNATSAATLTPSRLNGFVDMLITLFKQRVVALLVFTWTPVHFWSLAIVHRADYIAAAFALPATAWLIVETAKLLHTPAARSAMSLFKFSNAYLGIVLLAAMLAFGLP